MRFLVTCELFPTVIGDLAVQLRAQIAEQVQKVLGSGKVVASGVFSAKRGGFFLIDVDSPLELTELLAPTLIEHFAIQAHPVFPFEELPGLFQRIAPK